MATAKLKDKLKKTAQATSKAAKTTAQKSKQNTQKSKEEKPKNSTPVRNVKARTSNVTNKAKDTAKQQNRTPQKKDTKVQKLKDTVKESKPVQNVKKMEPVEKAATKELNRQRIISDKAAKTQVRQNEIAKGTLVPEKSSNVGKKYGMEKYNEKGRTENNPNTPAGMYKTTLSKPNLESTLRDADILANLSGKQVPITESLDGAMLAPLPLAKADSMSHANAGRWTNALPSKKKERTDKEVVQDAVKQLTEATHKRGARQQTLSRHENKLKKDYQDAIRLAKQDYDKAKNKGDTKGMQEAHERAERIRRIAGGFSGGVAGDENIKPKLEQADREQLNKEGEKRLSAAVQGYENAKTDAERAMYAAQGQAIRKDPRFQAADHKGAYRAETAEGRMMYAGTEEERKKEGEQAAAIPKAIGTGIAGSFLSLPGTTYRAMQTDASRNQDFLQNLSDIRGGGEVNISEAKVPERTKGWDLLNQSQAYRELATEGQSGLERYLTEALITGGEMAPGLIATALSGGAAAPGLVTMGLQAAGNTMGTLESQGVDSVEAFNRGVLSGAIEAGTELIPLQNLIKMGKGEAKSFARGMIAQLIEEVGTEEASEILGYGVDKFYENPDKTAEGFVKALKEGLPELGQNMKDTAAISALTSLGMGGGAGMINSVRQRKQVAARDIVTPSLEQIEAEEQALMRDKEIWKTTATRLLNQMKMNADDPAMLKHLQNELAQHQAEYNKLVERSIALVTQRATREGVEQDKAALPREEPQQQQPQEQPQEQPQRIQPQPQEQPQAQPVQQPQQPTGNPLLDAIGRKFGAEEQTQPPAPAEALQQAAQPQAQQEQQAPQEEVQREPGLDWNDEYIPNIPKRIANAIDNVAKALGVHVRFENLNEGVDPNDPNAVYDNGYLEGNTVVISRDIIDPVAAIVGHEFTHRMQKLAPEQYQTLKDYVKSLKKYQSVLQDKIDEYKAGGQELDPEGAWDEITADFAGEIINNEDLLNDFIEGNRHNPTLLQKVREFFANLAAKLTGKERVQVQKAVRMIDAALAQSVEAYSQGQTVEENGKQLHSFAGERADTADRFLLQAAKDMEEAGDNPETVRQQTGWHRGADGKWRFEIADNEAVIDWKGNAEDDLGIEHNYAKEDLYKPHPLYEFLRHPKLFEAYPELMGIDLKIEDMAPNSRGYYNNAKNEIVLNSDFLRPENEDEAMFTLLHETQHAIQTIEGFASGASPEYWQREIDRGNRILSKGQQKLLEQANNKVIEEYVADPEFHKEMNELLDMEPEGDDAYITDEDTGEIIGLSPQQEAWDKRFNEAIEKYGADRVDALYTALGRMKYMGMPENLKVLGAYYLYNKTAGEVEARDTSARRFLGDEGRKSIQPETGGDNVYFAEGNGWFGNENSVRYSKRKGNREAQEKAQQEITNEYKKTVDGILNGTINRGDSVLVGYTPDIYQELGVPSLPLVIGSGHIYTTAKSEAEARAENKYNRRTHYHGLGADAVKELYEAVKNPIAVIVSKDSGNKNETYRPTNKIVAIVDIGTGKTRRRIPVEITTEREMDGEYYNVNALSTAFDDSVERLMTDAVTQERIGEAGVYYIRKEAMPLISAGVQFPEPLQRAMASDGIVRQISDKVNLKIQNPTQSRQFTRWFGDWQNNPKSASKIVNDDGTPMEVYHGTDADFYTFDTSVSGGKNGTAEGFGIYVTPDKDVSSHYGERQIPLYANVRRPAYYNRKSITSKELMKLIQQTCVAEAQQMVDEGSYQNINDALRDTWISNYTYTYGSPNIQKSYKDVANLILKQNDNDMDIVQEIMAGMGIRDYESAMDFYHNHLTPVTKIDGFVTEWKNQETGKSSEVIVVFDSGQLKSAEDNVGTYSRKNKDIRYSKRRNAQYRQAVESGNTEEAQRMVDEAANEAGFRVPGYHGTQEFGFTVPDSRKSDDRLSFFVTGDLKTARTYSNVDGVRQIKDGAKRDEEWQKAKTTAGNKMGDGIEALADVTNNAFNPIKLYMALRQDIEKAGGKDDAEDSIESYFDSLVESLWEKNGNPGEGDYFDGEDWLEFDEGAETIRQPFNDARQLAYDYAHTVWGEDSDGNYKVYIDPTGLLEVEGNGANWGFIPFEPLGRKASTRDIAQWADENGYTGVHFKNIVDDGGKGLWRITEPADVYALFNPAYQTKSADPATYDDNGELIDLDKRFDRSQPDWRYSKRRGAGNQDMYESIYGKKTGRKGSYSVGAAPSGFDKYTHASNEYGAIEPGEKPARMVDVPKKMNKSTQVRRWTRTAMEAAVTPDEAIEGFEQGVVQGLFNYRKRTDRASLNAARKTLDDKGYEGAMEQWQDVVEGRRSSTKDDIVLAQCLYVMAARMKDFDTMRELAAQIAAEGTISGQKVQALRLLKKATPEGKLYYVTKVLDKIQAELEERKGDKAPTLTIDPELTEELLDAETEEQQNEALDKIYDNVASQIPSTIEDRLNAWRYFAMLGNPRTHIRNVLGNVVVQAPLQASNKVSALMQSALPQEKRTRALVSSRDAMRFARDDFKEMKNILSNGGKYMSEQDEIERRRKLYPAPIQKLMDWNSAALEGEDMLFKKGTYIHSLASFITARGWNPQEMTEAQLEEARNHAIKDALHATFQNESALAKAISKAERYNRATKIAIGGLVPFKNVPINIAKMGFELSPAGLIKALTRDAAKVRKGKMDATDMIDHMTRGLTGTSVALLGYFLASQGMLTAGGDDDKEDAFNMAQGTQNYALNLGDISYTIDWMAPSAIPLFLGAEYFNHRQRSGEESEDDDKQFKDGLESLSRLFDPMLNMTVLSGVSDTLDTVAYSKTNAVWPLAWGVTQNYGGQFVPTLLGQIARTYDDTRRTTYIDRNSPVPNSIQRFLQKQENKIPGLSKNNIPYLDAWDREDVEENPMLRAFENFVSPGYIARKNTDYVDEELGRLNELGLEGVLPSKPKTSTKVNDEYLSADEYLTLAKTEGKTSRDILEEVVGTPEYNALTDEEKAAYVKKIFDFGKQVGKLEVGMPEEKADSYVLNAKEGEKEVGLSPAKFLANYVKKLAIDKQEDVDDTMKAVDFEIAVDSQDDLTDEQKQFIKDKVKVWRTIPVDTSSYNKARDAGMTTDEAKRYMEIKKTADTDNNNSLTDDERIVAIKNSGEPEEVQAMMWEAMKRSDDKKTWADAKAKAAEAEKKQAEKEAAYKKLFGNMDTEHVDNVIQYINTSGGGVDVSYTQFAQTMRDAGVPYSEWPLWFNYYNSRRGYPWQKSFGTVAKSHGWG